MTKKYETYKSDRWVGKSNVYLCFLFADEKVLSKGAHRPVSYTHLDVYKRQCRGKRSAGYRREPRRT